MQVISADTDLDQGTLDWIDSIQQRFGEVTGAKVATVLQAGGRTTGSHMLRVQAMLARMGIPFVPERPRLSQPRNQYDEVETRTRLTDIAQKLEPFWADLGMGQGRLMVSSLPSLSQLTFCVTEPGVADAYHIFYDEELGTFTNMLSKLLAELVIFVPQGSIRFVASEQLADMLDKGLGNVAFDLFYQTCRTGSSRASKPRIPGRPEQVEFAVYFARSIESFIIGHEIAHIALGHLNNPEAALRYEGVPDFSSNVYSHRMEFDADRTGVLLSHSYLSSVINRSISVLSAAAFLRSWETVRLCSQHFKKEDGMLSTHPAPLRRTRNVAKVARTLNLPKRELAEFRTIFLQLMKCMDLVEAWVENKIRESVQNGTLVHERKLLISKIERPKILG